MIRARSNPMIMEHGVPARVAAEFVRAMCRQTALSICTKADLYSR